MFETRPAVFAPETPLTDLQESILHIVHRGRGNFTSAHLCKIYAPENPQCTRARIDWLLANGFITFGEAGWKLTPAGDEMIGR